MTVGRGIPHRAGKGCPSKRNAGKRIVFRFHETILSFGEPGSLLGCPRKLYSKRLVSGL